MLKKFFGTTLKRFATGTIGALVGTPAAIGAGFDIATVAIIAVSGIVLLVAGPNAFQLFMEAWNKNSNK